MKKIVLVILAGVLYVTQAHAVTDNQMQALFAKSGDTLARFTALCAAPPVGNTDELVAALVKQCATDVRAAKSDLNKHKSLYADGNLTSDLQKGWLESHHAMYMRISIDLDQIVRRLNDTVPTSNLFDPLQPHKQLTGVSCGDVLAVATAVCSLYLVAPAAGPFLAAICEAVAIAGYIRCITTEQSGGQTS